MSDQPKIKPEKPLRALLCGYEKWEAEGIPCHHVRFQAEIPPAKDMQPVGEFYTKQNKSKYVVDSMVYTPHGVIWRAFGEVNIVPLANIQLARFKIR